jgi:hypothetical protein
MKSIKNQYIDLPVFVSLGALKLFKDKFGQSFEVYMADKDSDKYGALGYLVFQSHLSACKVEGTKPKVESETDLMDFLSIHDLAQITELIQPEKSEGEAEKEPTDQKKI